MSPSQTPDLVNYWQHKNKKYRFDCYLKSDFSNLQDVSQVYGIVYNEAHEILLVSQNNELWNLPGGTVEPGEGYIETLVRELKEEANTTVEIENLTPLFYQSVYQEKNDWVFESNQIRYISPLLEKKVFISDPGGHVISNKFVPLEELHSHLRWGEVSAWLQDELAEWFKK